MALKRGTRRWALVACLVVIVAPWQSSAIGASAAAPPKEPTSSAGSIQLSPTRVRRGDAFKLTVTIAPPGGGIGVGDDIYIQAWDGEKWVTRLTAYTHNSANPPSFDWFPPSEHNRNFDDLSASLGVGRSMFRVRVPNLLPGRFRLMKPFINGPELGAQFDVIR